MNAEVANQEIWKCNSLLSVESPGSPDRTTQLAVECWNLRKLVLEQNSQLMKRKQEIKSGKHLIANLQKLIHDAQADCHNKSRELLSMKAKNLELEKKLHDSVLTTNCMNSSATRHKRNLQYMQQRVNEAVNEVKASSAKHDEAMLQVTTEARGYESATSLVLKQLADEKEKLYKEKQYYVNCFEDSQNRVTELEKTVNELRNTIEQINFDNDCERNETRNTNEQIQADLQRRLEHSLTQQKVLARHAAERDHENYQLSGYILCEGLQFPCLTKLPPERQRDDEIQ